MALVDRALCGVRDQFNYGLRRLGAHGGVAELDDQTARRRSAAVGARADRRTSSCIVARSAPGVAHLLLDVRGPLVRPATRAVSPRYALQDLSVQLRQRFVSRTRHPR